MPIWRKKGTEKEFRLFFATDVHGSEPAFRKFINAGKFYKVDALVLGGDITGKLMVPILTQENGDYRATLQSKTYTLQDQDQLHDFEAKLAKLGYYGCMVNQSEYQLLRQDHREVERLYQEKAKERLAAWVRLAEERLADTDIHCYITGGNDDSPEVLEVLRQEAQEHVIPCEDQVVELNNGGHKMVSLGYSNPTPWNTPREIEDAEITHHIDAAVAGIDDFSRVVFNFHAPPIDSTLDTCPLLDASTDPPTVITKGGEPVLFGAGSHAVRDAIERYQPLLSMHGHIHESRGVIKIGRTTAVNPGSEYGEGILRGIIITLVGDQVKSTQMTSG